MEIQNSPRGTSSENNCILATSGGSPDFGGSSCCINIWLVRFNDKIVANCSAKENHPPKNSELKNDQKNAHDAKRLMEPVKQHLKEIKVGTGAHNCVRFAKNSNSHYKIVSSEQLETRLAKKQLNFSSVFI